MSVQSFEWRYMNLGEIHMLINRRHKLSEISSSIYFLVHGLFAQYCRVHNGCSKTSHLVI